MRCQYCRSITHENDCPKELEDRLLPIYTAVHKLAIAERMAAARQQPLYALKEAIELRARIKTKIKEFVDAENAKNAPLKPVESAKKTK